VRTASSAYLIDAEGVDMVERAWSLRRPDGADDAGALRGSTRVLCHARPCGNSGATTSRFWHPAAARPRVKIAYETDCGMFPFSPTASARFRRW